MLLRSSIPTNTLISETNTIVQTAKSGATLSAVGRADVGTTYKNALIFEDGELHDNLISIPRLDDDGCKIVIENNKLIVTKGNKTIITGEKSNGLYTFDLNGTEHALLADPQPKDRASLLKRIHNRLGHRNLLRIRNILRTIR